MRHSAIPICRLDFRRGSGGQRVDRPERGYRKFAQFVTYGVGTSHDLHMTALGPSDAHFLSGQLTMSKLYFLKKA